jgi:hypothetical protein
MVWQNHPESKIQIFHSEVDDAGYDVVLTWRKITRHIQLKASHLKAKRTEIDVHSALAEAAGGCVIWMFYDPLNLDIKFYRFFGSAPAEGLPDLAGFRIAKRVFPNMNGIRPERKRIRAIPKGAFAVVPSLEELATLLFGIRF